MSQPSITIIPMMATTNPKALGGGRPTPSRMRFPCGHLEGQASVARRIHERPRALVVSCRKCNLVVLVVAPSPRSRAG